jgi:hypothetical protein
MRKLAAWVSSGIKFIVLHKTFIMDSNRMSPENRTKENKPMETDSSEIVRRHLEDENHEITDEDIRNVKIVSTDDEPTTTGAEVAARFTEEESEEEKDTGTRLPDADATPGTPWDVLSE